MNITNSDFKTIEKALMLLPHGEEFEALTDEQQNIIVKADVTMVKLLKKKKKDVARQTKYINEKRSINKNYGRGKSMYVRKTRDYWSIHSQYGVECNCSTLAEAKANLQDYKENVPYAVWIEKHRERI